MFRAPSARFLFLLPALLLQLRLSAADLSDLTYDATGDTVTITDCHRNAAGALEIPELIEGKPVTVIGESAFNSCFQLVTVILPSTVRTIGDFGFANCLSLEEVPLPEGLEAIGQAAFSATKLTLIEIPASLTSLGRDVFSQAHSYEVDPDNLHYSSRDGILYTKDQETLLDFPPGNPTTSFTIGPRVHTLGEGAFERSDLETIIIPDHVTSIGKQAFRSCGLLRNLTVGQGVTEIPDWCFEGAENLRMVTLPPQITSIGARAFNSCLRLESVILPANLVSLGDAAFSRCFELETITLPDSVTSIGDLCFTNCGDLTTITFSAQLEMIGEEAFYRCHGLSTVTLPDGVTTIGVSCFSNCERLTSITLGESLLAIPTEAFDDCGRLETVGIPDSVISIGERAFHICGALSSALLPRNLEEIRDYAFHRTSSLPAVSLPGGVTTIGENAFSRSGIETLVIEDSPATVGRFAFSDCPKLRTVSLGNRVSAIGPAAFSQCPELREVTIPDSVETVGSAAFSNCMGLEYATLGRGLREYPEGFFFGRASNLRRIEVSGDNPILKSLDGVVYSKDGETLVYLPEGYPGPVFFSPPGLKTVGARSFARSQNLTDIFFQEGLVTVENRAFGRSPNLKRVHFPSTVTFIDDKAFQDLPVLEKIYFGGDAPLIGQALFEDSSPGIEIAITPEAQHFGGIFANRPLVIETFQAPPPALGKPFRENMRLVLPYTHLGDPGALILFQSSDLESWAPVEEAEQDPWTFQVPIGPGTARSFYQIRSAGP